jgi:hypothetical protein
MYWLGYYGVHSDCIDPPLGSTSSIIPYPRLTGLIREEGSKVYYWPVTWDNEYLAFDFNHVVGDTVPLYQTPHHLTNLTILSIVDTVLQGRTFKRFDAGRDTIFEGIGNIRYPFSQDYGVALSVQTICYSRNDTVYFQRQDDCAFYLYDPTVSTESNIRPKEHSFVKEIYPTPASDFVEVAFTAPADYTIGLYNMHGQQVMSQSSLGNSWIRLNTRDLPAGVYILMLSKSGESPIVTKIILTH